MEGPFADLLGVSIIAFLVPFGLGFFPRLRLPAVVLEVVAGIIVGPQVLGWVAPTFNVTTLSSLGVAFLLFLAGLELDLNTLKGAPARSGAIGFVFTFVLAILLMFPLGAANVILSPLFIAIALSATSVGIIVPVLRDTGQLDSKAGLYTLAGGSVGEFATIAMVGIFFSVEGTSPIFELVLMLVMAVVALLGLRLMSTMSKWQLGRSILDRLDESTSLPRVRLGVMIIIAAATLSLAFGFEAILGTFLAGILFGIVIRGDRYEHRLRSRLEAIGFGFLVPVFFITSGLRFDAQALTDPKEWLVAGLFFAVLFTIHVVPALVLFRKELGARSAFAVGLMHATNLSFIVVAVGVGIEIGRLKEFNGSALVIAGLLSAVVFPAVAQILLPHGEAMAADTEIATEIGERL